MIHRQRNAGGGKSGALNTALSRLKGEWLLVLDADAQLQDDLLERLKALEQVVLQLSISIKHQQPLTLETAQSGVERTRLATTGVALAMNHIESRVPGGQLVEQLGGPIKTSVVDHPGGELSGRIAKGCKPIYQTRHHRLFVAGRHHHIKAGKLRRIDLWYGLR